MDLIVYKVEWTEIIPWTNPPSQEVSFHKTIELAKVYRLKRINSYWNASKPEPVKVGSLFYERLMKEEHLRFDKGENYDTEN
jgi:hypothetical protein